jgi:hypothetical protein
MFRDLAGILGFFLEILLNPVLWAAIILWVLYKKRKKRILKIWAIVCTVTVVIAHLVLIPLSRYLTGYYQGVPTQAETTQKTESTQAETTQKTESNQATSTTVDNETLAKIDDYYNNLDEHRNYIYDLQDVKTEIDEDILDLAEKLAETNSKQEALVYLKLEKDKYEEVINGLAGIFVPEILKEFHSYLVDYYTLQKQKTSFMISSISGASVNHSEYEILSDNADNANTKALQELKRVSRYFNNEAEELGLPKPLPDQ